MTVKITENPHEEVHYVARQGGLLCRHKFSKQNLIYWTAGQARDQKIK